MIRKKYCVWAARALAALLLTALLQGVFSPAAEADASAVRTVRVGYFAFDGYHMVDGLGARSGYGYDYLQYLSRYANFSYEYVGYDKSWGEMQDMLEAGEIDLLTSAQKTGERLERFDFSDEPIGSSEAILTVRAGDERYIVDDYKKLEGIRIGLLEGNSRNKNLEKFSLAQGFSYRPVYYSDAAELEQALQTGGEIDAILTSSLRKIQDEWIIATFDSTPFYIMVRKGDSALLGQVNRALKLLHADYPDLSASLSKRYYSPESGDEIPYTAEERAYIRDRRESAIPVAVTLSSGCDPLSFFVDGEAMGIIPKIAAEVMRRTGLPYTFVPTSPAVDARELLMRGEASVCFDGSSDFNEAERCGLRVTDPYLELPLSYITRREFSGSPASVAVLRNPGIEAAYLEKLYGSAAVFRYDSVDACLDAVLSGRQDAAFFQTYIAQKLVNADARSRIKEQLAPGYSLSFAVSAAVDDALLFSILNKAVLSLNPDEINQLVVAETSMLSRDISLTDYLYSHPILALEMLAAAACFVIVLLLYIFRRRKLRLERDKAREFERFITYVCKANTKVMEIAPTSGEYVSYHVEEGKVISQTQPIKPGSTHFADVHPEDWERVRSLAGHDELNRLIETGSELYLECRVRPKCENPYRWFSYTFQGVPGDAEYPGRLMMFAKDIDRTKREESEKRQALQDALTAARQAGEARGTFLSRMSHEIRTPLNAIIGYLTIARANLNNPAKAGGCLDKSEFATRQLLNIVNDVLDLSAIESGRMKIAYETFNIKDLVEGLTSIFHAQSVKKAVTFRVRLKGLTEEELIGDQLRLNQILLNLLSNAVKFTPEGGRVTLTILQKALVDSSVYLQFEVADTGVGMSDEYKTRLFQPFEQQDSSTARKFGGTGLGLSITKNLVAMMNGTIDVQSEEGRGSLFTVNLSFKLAQARKIGPADCDFSGLQALVLYGPDNDYPYLQTLLKRLGIASDLALSPEEAARLLSDGRTRYDLCFIDWDSPDVAGMETARQLLESASDEPPELLAVAYEPPALQTENCLIKHVILKPVFQSSLFNVLSGLYHRRTETAAAAVEQLTPALLGVRLLLAEDNTLNMEIATEILGGYGLIVDTAKNGLEAVERFEQSAPGTYQAILMDIQMPVLNGYDAARRIRAGGHPQAGAIPIIALTADAFAEDINRTLAAGMDAHVSKPIDFPQLCAVLVKFISPNQ